ncbi:hypothetical protein GGR57DRAFT_463368 [Xylariaceae sp. FL1272]|nr:hypothetical protein GGR57DRAFT_463368 [Xylariaceae sp. FL1272]
MHIVWCLILQFVVFPSFLLPHPNNHQCGTAFTQPPKHDEPGVKPATAHIRRTTHHVSNIFDVRSDHCSNDLMM